MTTPNAPSQKTQPDVPKNNNGSEAPPPAYTPPRRSAENLAAMLANRMPGYQIQQFFPGAEAQHVTLPSAVAGDEDDATKSPISLRINSSINITQNNNIVCVESSPTENANAIAQSVTKAILEGSSGQCGIPMIDENGVPRPLMIEVDAGLVIKGANNIVGNRATVDQALRQQWNHASSSSLRRPREDDDDDQSQPAAKRRLSE